MDVLWHSDSKLVHRLPVPPLQLRYNSVSLIQHGNDPPHEGGFPNSLVGRDVLCNFHRVGLFEIFEIRPVRAAIFPLH